MPKKKYVRTEFPYNTVVSSKDRDGLVRWRDDDRTRTISRMIEERCVCYVRVAEGWGDILLNGLLLFEQTLREDRSSFRRCHEEMKHPTARKGGEESR